jgi:hypothetical protein
LCYYYCAAVKGNAQCKCVDIAIQI